MAAKSYSVLVGATPPHNTRVSKGGLGLQAFCGKSCDEFPIREIQLDSPRKAGGNILGALHKEPTRPKSGRMGLPPQDCLSVGESPGGPPRSLEAIALIGWLYVLI